MPEAGHIFPLARTSIGSRADSVRVWPSEVASSPSCPEIDMLPFFFPLMALFPFIAGGAILYLALRFVRATERRQVDQGELEALRELVRLVEEELARTTSDVERLSEEQRFTLKLLAERAATLPPAS